MAASDSSFSAVLPQSPALSRVALYARVSTLNHHQDPEMQLRELREFCARRGWAITGEYIDQGQSGSKDRRPALDRLMDAARSRQIDVVIVWKLDRWGRSLKHIVNSLADLESLGVSFISLRDNLDLTTASGRMLMQIIGVMAEFERSLIQERVRAGLRNARAKGIRLGRPAAVVDAARIRDLRAAGASWRVVSEQMGRGVATCFRHLQRAGGTTEDPGSRGAPCLLLNGTCPFPTGR
jgi:DNA invertase Pin-like site-specific DNA recombinase